MFGPKSPPVFSDSLNIAWKQNQNDLKGRLIVNPHTAYFSSESLNECRSKACFTCLDIINKRIINNRIV